MNLIVPLLVIAAAAASNVAASNLVKRDGNTYFFVYLPESKYVLDFPSPNGQASAAGTQLQTYQYNGGKNQFFTFVPTNQYGDDNSYKIVNLQTGYCVDALGRGTTNGTPVGLYNCNDGADNQIWSLKRFGDGYFVVSMMSNRCLKVLGDTPASGSKIGLWDCLTDSQNATSMVWNTHVDAIGHFWSQLKTQNNMVLDFPSPNGGAKPPGTQIQIYNSNGGQNQQFRFELTDDGYLTMINQYTGYCLDVPNNATTTGSPVALSICNGQDSQKWTVVPIQERGITVSSFFAWVVGMHSAKCLNAYGATYNLEDKVALWDCSRTDNAVIWEIGFNAFPNKYLDSRGTSGLQNVEVILLLWGNVNNAGSYPDFYQTLLSSRVFEMLGQYGIGAGSYKGYMQLPPNGGPALPRANTNDDIRAYLHQLAKAGYLKPNGNTYYAVHFAPDSGAGCSGYCAYHSAEYIFDIPNRATDRLVYGVMPDLNGCNCGGSNVFEAQTMAAAHELVEAVTDPLIGFRDRQTLSEIGDLCAYRTFSITGANGNSYVIQKFWSNIANACVE
ncbi:hypothetical protein HDU76_000433 [Blyttiomyces sp. JEL0837]|nr:hypothetical protein HDU76_000433 [Blyttiomyces sp. JEL0837]